MADSPFRTILRSALAGMAASVAYGIVHDQITIRICPEYFLVWHPKLTESTNLTYVALLWGVVATWWMGAGLGVLLGMAATLGGRPPAPFGKVRAAIAWIMLASGVTATIAGCIANATGFRAPTFVMRKEIAGMGPDVQQRFTVDLVIHNASYTASAVAAILGASWLIWYRARRL